MELVASVNRHTLTHLYFYFSLFKLINASYLETKTCAEKETLYSSECWRWPKSSFFFFPSLLKASPGHIIFVLSFNNENQSLHTSSVSELLL